MTRFQAIATIRRFASEGKVEIVEHAILRLSQRNFTASDVLHAMTNLRTASHQKFNDRWLSTGPSLDGRSCRLVIVIEENAVVVTVWDANQ